MQTAIDRQVIGKEKEINISEFDGYKAKERFICPECGEYVFASVGNKKKSFKHHKGKGLDCELRINSKSLTFYERVGLPIYLINENGLFSLKMGFYALGKDVLGKINNENLKVNICDENNTSYYEQYGINSMNFYEDNITLKSINFIPDHNINYKIKVVDDKNKLCDELTNKWSDYADGFSSDGAIFSYSENQGKKIRRNDTITINTEYYLLLFHKSPGIDIDYISSFKVQEKECYVYKITIVPSGKNEFSNIENYLWSRFKLKLLYNKPDTIQVWPPAVKNFDTNYSIPLKSKNSIVCKVKSDSDEPKVYKYFSKEYNQIDIKEVKGECSFIRLNINNDFTPITIDRKYLANAQIYSPNRPFNIMNEIELTFDSVDLFLHRDINIYQCLVENSEQLISDFNIKVIKLLKNGEFIYENKEEFIYENKKDAYVFLYFQEIKQMFLIYRNDNTVNDNVDLKLLKRSLSSRYIRIPMKYRNIYTSIRGNIEINKVLKPVIVNGKIPVGALKVLIDGGILNE